MAIDIESPGADEADLKAALRALLAPRGARISRVTNQTASGAGVDDLVTFTAEDWDTDAVANLGTSTTRLTVPSGYTQIRMKGYVRFTAVITTCFLNMKKNGSFMAATTGKFENTATAQAMSAVSGVMTVTAGDYFEMNTFASGARTVSEAWFEMELIA